MCHPGVINCHQLPSSKTGVSETGSKTCAPETKTEPNAVLVVCGSLMTQSKFCPSTRCQPFCLSLVQRTTQGSGFH